MKKTICKREYDTEVSTVIKKYTYGHFGDATGFEEVLFQTPEGLYFLFVKGGSSSPYPEEDILRLGKAKVSQWLEAH